MTPGWITHGRLKPHVRARALCLLYLHRPHVQVSFHIYREIIIRDDMFFLWRARHVQICSNNLWQRTLQYGSSGDLNMKLYSAGVNDAELHSALFLIVPSIGFLILRHIWPTIMTKTHGFRVDFPFNLDQFPSEISHHPAPEAHLSPQA